VKSAKKSLGARLIKTDKNISAMLKDFNPKLTLVSTEAVKAPAVIETVLKAGSHVFAEKPACVQSKDFERLVQLADGKHLHLMLALANRLNPEITKARQLLKTGTIGKVYGIDLQLVADQTRLTRTSYQKAWFTKKSRSGGGFLSWLGIHWLDLASFLTDLKVQQVAGFTANVGGQPIDIEDSAAATMRYENNVLGTLISGYFLDRGYNSQIKIWGSSGWIQLQQMESSPLSWYSSKGKNKGVVQKYTGPKQPRGYTPFVHSCVRACAGLQSPPVSNVESLHAVKTVYAIYDAAKSGKTVTV
jgi:predicted dehydrogenase